MPSGSVRSTDAPAAYRQIRRSPPAVYQGLASILREHDIPLRTIPGTLDVWCRDYLPVQVAEDRFMQFRYAPDYLTGKYRHLRADGEIGPKLPWIGNCERSEIVLDGGNVVAWGDRAIVTDRVYRENAASSREGVRAALQEVLGLAGLIVVPKEPFDPIGHADGMACWLDGRTVLTNDYSSVGEGYRRRFRSRFDRHGIDLVELPYEPQAGGRDGIPTAAGNWINFLRVRDVLIVPSFGLKGDARALGLLRELHPGHAVSAVDCRDLAEEGGLLRCVTWQMMKTG